MEFRKVIDADALIRTDLATIRADKRTQIEWLDKIVTAVQELQPHIEDVEVLGRIDTEIIKLRVELRRPIPRKRHISVGWLNIITYLLVTVSGDAEGLEKTRKDELIQLFTDFVEHLSRPALYQPD
jgi:hypothetical protein